jgi:hypothetical protein
MDRPNYTADCPDQPYSHAHVPKLVFNNSLSNIVFIIML